MTEIKDQDFSTFDCIIEQLGQWRKYHIINNGLLFFGIYLSALHALAFVFIAGEIDFRCQVPECESLTERNWTDWAFPLVDDRPAKCQRYATKSNSSSDICSLEWFDNTSTFACDQFVYGLNGDSSIMKDFDLGCQQWKRTLIGSIYKCGFLFSVILSGTISDRFGRKTAIAFSGFSKGIIGVIKSFSYNYETFTVLLFLESALGGGLFNSCFILLMETASSKNRQLIGCLVFIVASLGSTTIGGLAWLIRDWRTILRIIYTPAIFVILYLWILDESARWLLAKNRHSDAIKVIRKAEKINGVTIPENLIEELYLRRKTTNEESKNVEDEKFINAKSSQTNKASTLKNVLRSPIILKRVICCGFLWLACTFTFNGISINSVQMTNNRHLSFIIINLTQIPACITAYLITNRIGRRKTLILSFVICGISSFASTFVPKDIFIVAIIPTICAKFTITMVFLTLNMYTSEIFPTFLRQSLLGMCLLLGHMGSLFAPQVQLIGYYMESLPSLLFGLVTVASGLLAMTIPETAKIKLPDTIEEAEKINMK